MKPAKTFQEPPNQGVAVQIHFLLNIVKNNLQIYPNPANEEITITLADSETSLNLASIIYTPAVKLEISNGGITGSAKIISDFPV